MAADGSQATTVSIGDEQEQRNEEESSGYSNKVCKMGVLGRISRRIHGGISEFFRREGILLARRPRAVIFVCILVWMALLIPLIDIRFPGKGPIPFIQELDKDRLYSPTSAPALRDREFVEDVWGDDVLLTSVYLVSHNSEKPNVLTKPHLLELMTMWESIAALRVEYENRTYGWEDVCARSKLLSDGTLLPCKVFSLLDAWDMNRTILESDRNVLSTVTEKTVDASVEGSSVAAVLLGKTTAFGSPLFRSLVLGSEGVVLGRNEEVLQAEVLRISLFKQTRKVEINGRFYDPVESAWEMALVDLVVNKWNGTLLEAHVGSFSQVDQISEDTAEKESYWVILSFGLVLLVSHIVLFRNQRAFCKAHLALISVVAITMAIASSHGLVNLLGVPYNVVVRTVPFLLVGLGMDDTFVIMGAYSMVPYTLPIEERIARTMQHAGSSILITSITDFVAFSVGTFAQIPAVQAFCLYAAVGVLFDFLYQVTFFVAFVVLDARRESRILEASVDSDSKKVVGTDELPSFSTVVVSAASRDLPDFVPPAPEQTAEPAEEADNAFPKWFGKGNYDPEAPTFGRRLIGVKLPKIILSTYGKVAVLVIEAVLLGLAIYGCTKVYMDFRYLEWFTPKDSFLYQTIAIEDKYFQGEQLGFSIYTQEPSDGQDLFYHLDEMKQLSEEILSSPYISKDPIPVSSWYESFIMWSRAKKLGQTDANGHAPDAETFNAWMKEFLDDQGQVFLDAIKFSADGSKILSTRFLAFTQPVGAMKAVLDDVDTIRASVRAAAPSLSPFPYGFAFPFLDSFRMITSETIQNVLVAGAAVFVICLLILADLLTTVWVVLMVALTDVFLFGFMHYADLQFNIVTSINIILAVGIAVDYSSHVAHAYLAASGSRQERARWALYCIGGEVFSGAFTTWVAVLGFGFATHYIFKVFFKMFSVVVFAGLWHGIVVLPVVLSLMGSPSNWGPDEAQGIC